MTLSELREALDRLSTLKQELEMQNDIKKSIENDIDGLRHEILIGLQDQDVRSLKNSAFTVSRKADTKVEITDVVKLTSYFVQHNVPLESYMAIATTNAKKIAKQVYKEDGEIIPGVEIVNDEILAVTPNKEAK